MNISVVCANIIEKEGKFLMVKETKERVKGKYNLPAGKLENDESLIEAAKREAREETGLEVEPVSLVNVGQKVYEGKDKTLLIFTFHSKIKEGKLRTTREHPEVDYFSYEEIEDMDKKGLLRSVYIKPAVDDYREGKSIGLSSLKIFRS